VNYRPTVDVEVKRKRSFFVHHDTRYAGKYRRNTNHTAPREGKVLCGRLKVTTTLPLYSLSNLKSWI